MGTACTLPCRNAQAKATGQLVLNTHTAACTRTPTAALQPDQGSWCSKHTATYTLTGTAWTQHASHPCRSAPARSVRRSCNPRHSHGAPRPAQSPPCSGVAGRAAKAQSQRHSSSVALCAAQRQRRQVTLLLVGRCCGTAVALKQADVLAQQLGGHVGVPAVAAPLITNVHTLDPSARKQAASLDMLVQPLGGRVLGAPGKRLTSKPIQTLKNSPARPHLLT